MKGWKWSQGIKNLPRRTAETFCMLTELTCLCAVTNYSADRKGSFVFFIFYHPSQFQQSSKPRWLMLAPAELSGASYPSFSPPRPPVQNARGPLLLRMVTKNMGFKARLPYYKMSKQKPTRPVAVQRPVQWAESCGYLPSNCWRPNERVWDSHSLI